MNAPIIFGVTSQVDVTFYSFLIIGAFFALFAAYIIGHWIQSNSTGRSPYTSMPLRRGSDLPYESCKKILQFLYDKHSYDNRVIDLRRAAICRETGRVFPDCVSWFETVHVDWTFLKKKFPGNYVSWGSLTDMQQISIRDQHESLEGFQTEQSCPKPAPSDISSDFILTKPGPLYVDLDTMVLLGWQCVNNSTFEVLIVQRPKKRNTYKW